MEDLKKLARESDVIWAVRLGALASEKLEGITDELKIREVTLKYWKPIREGIPSDNSIKRVRTAFVGEIRRKFPDSDSPKDGYYQTKPRGQNTPIWEHLALWYATSNTNRWDVIGDEARASYDPKGLRKNQPQVEQHQVEQPQVEPQVELPPQQEKPVTITLKAETLEFVKSTIGDTLSIDEFYDQAALNYAKLLGSKKRQSEQDLTTITTEELLSNSKYKTHPGRPEELTRRAIYAIEINNQKATEKSQRWAITQSAIQSITGSKPAIIKSVLEKYKTRIDDHNAKYELTANDNRKNTKITDAINLTALVPSGLDIV